MQPYNNITHGAHGALRTYVISYFCMWAIPHGRESILIGDLTLATGITPRQLHI